MAYILPSLFGIITVWFGIDTYVRYRAAEGSVWSRLLHSAAGSATMLWSRFVAVLGSMIGLIGAAGDSIGLPNARDYAQTLLGNPTYVAIALIVFSAITAWARRRTL